MIFNTTIPKAVIFFCYVSYRFIFWLGISAPLTLTISNEVLWKLKEIIMKILKLISRYNFAFGNHYEYQWEDMDVD